MLGNCFKQVDIIPDGAVVAIPMGWRRKRRFASEVQAMLAWTRKQRVGRVIVHLESKATVAGVRLSGVGSMSAPNRAQAACLQHSHERFPGSRDHLHAQFRIGHTWISRYAATVFTHFGMSRNVHLSQHRCVYPAGPPSLSLSLFQCSQSKAGKQHLRCSVNSVRGGPKSNVDAHLPVDIVRGFSNITACHKR